MTVDAPLADALERARRARRREGARKPARTADASLIHDLAIAGAGRLEREGADRGRLLAELADPELTAAHLDPEALEEVLRLRDVDPLAGGDA